LDAWIRIQRSGRHHHGAAFHGNARHGAAAPGAKRHAEEFRSGYAVIADRRLLARETKIIELVEQIRGVRGATAAPTARAMTIRAAQRLARDLERDTVAKATA